jgi:hypothetical protein
MMKKLFIAFAIAWLGTVTYYTHRLWVFAPKVSHAFEYYGAAIDCLIMEDGWTQGDVQDLAKHKKLNERKMYDDQIPECHIFFSRYRCWMLDPHDPGSLDGCGKHFGLTQLEIDTMKKDPSTIDAVMKANWDRRKEKGN